MRVQGFRDDGLGFRGLGSGVHRLGLMGLGACCRLGGTRNNLPEKMLKKRY